MSPTIFRLRCFLSYWLDAVDEHSLHSPFFYDFHTHVVRSTPGRQFEGFEKLRRKLLSDRRVLPAHDLGSGNRRPARSVASIARTSLSPPGFSALYARLIRHFKCQSIVELGTSFGINSLYLAANPGARVTTFEGSPHIAEIASLTFEFASAANIQLVQGNIDKTFPVFLQSIRKLDFAFIDANHRYAPTLSYFEQLMPRVTEKSIVVIDDIHHSPEMHRAWKALQRHRLVHASADLFRCGIVFFDPSLNKQHVILQV